MSEAAMIAEQNVVNGKSPIETLVKCDWCCKMRAPSDFRPEMLNVPLETNHGRSGKADRDAHRRKCITCEEEVKKRENWEERRAAKAKKLYEAGLEYVRFLASDDDLFIDNVVERRLQRAVQAIKIIRFMTLNESAEAQRKTQQTITGNSGATYSMSGGNYIAAQSPSFPPYPNPISLDPWGPNDLTIVDSDENMYPYEGMPTVRDQRPNEVETFQTRMQREIITAIPELMKLARVHVDALHLKAKAEAKTAGLVVEEEKTPQRLSEEAKDVTPLKEGSN